MLKLGIIEVGESDYMSPMILVEVAGEEPRPCIDYRKLNGIIRTEYFPLPNIEERVEKVSAAKFITVLDLSKGYWQIQLSKTAQRDAAFCTSFGFCTPSEVKVQDVLEFPTPRTKTQIRAFLGLAAGYYQKHINLFSVIAAPLKDALKGRAKKGEITWTTECENTFRELKGKLIDKPVLYAPNFEREFIVQTDALNAGMGAVLTQLNEQGEEHPILYLSKKFSQVEKRYCTTEKECASIVFAIKRIRYRYSFKRYSLVLVAALWDKKLAFRTRERRKFWVFTDGPQRREREKDIFGSRAAIEFSLGEGERPAKKRSNLSIVFTATVSEGIAIFGSRAAIEFSFGEKERPAQRRSN
ncbi:retrovirus-related Pol polyprotein from transposon 297 [Trichonephila clavipes]|nr:retrovirus-related Pol polyprotein from transposon 297 [Trichonephila clavipes]